jgi:hypothetical protein
MDKSIRKKPVVLAVVLYHGRPKDKLSLHFIVIKRHYGYYTGNDNNDQCDGHAEIFAKIIERMLSGVILR